MILLMMISGAVMAQSIYFRAGTGYGIPIASAKIGDSNLRTEVNNTTGNTSTSSTKGVNASYGSGNDLNFAFGYKLNENLIIDLNFQYLMGRKFKTADNYTYTSGTYSYVDNDVTTTSAKGIFINPSLIFSAGFGKAAPYARFGFVFGSPTVTSENNAYYNGDGIDSSVTRGEFKKGLAFGFQGAVGMNWKLSEKLDLFTEINFTGMTYYAGEYNITKSIYSSGSNVTDDLINMPLSQKQTIYKKKFDPSKVNIDSTKPHIASRESSPFSSLAFQAGIRFTLWKMAE